MLNVKLRFIRKDKSFVRIYKNETDLLARPNKLLHIAPEDALKNIFKQTDNLRYVNADININLADEEMDITSINYPDNTFDYIICCHVLGHIPDEKKAIDELFRVLKKEEKH